MISTIEMLSGFDIQIVSVFALGEPYTVQRRTHRKGRTNKKWRKRYGEVIRYRDNHKILEYGRTLIMTKSTLQMLKERYGERRADE